MQNSQSNLILEACVETSEDALMAQSRGANRIELCASLDQDGLTPSRELALTCIAQLAIPVMVMIRPRPRNFVYSEDEIRQMEADIVFFRNTGVAGIVFGMLTPERIIDHKNTLRLSQLAQPLEVTFHKAIDYSRDVYESFKELNQINEITRVLSSGGKDTAWNGRFLLKQMQEFPERRLQIIAAGRVVPDNITTIAEFTGVTELHGKRIV